MGHSSYTHPDVVGVVLAGGQSRRMGACDKSLMPLGAKPMIGHVIERMRPQVDALIINANGDPASFAPFGLPVVADAYGELTAPRFREHHGEVHGPRSNAFRGAFAGPLGGVLTAMRWAREHRPGACWLATAACDTPFIPAGYVAALMAAVADADAKIAVAASGGQRHHVLGLWSIALADDLAAWLAGGDRKVMLWVERYCNVVVPFAAESGGGDPFFNVNTPEEFAVAERQLRGEA